MEIQSTSNVLACDLLSTVKDLGRYDVFAIQLAGGYCSQSRFWERVNDADCQSHNTGTRGQFLRIGLRTKCRSGTNFQSRGRVGSRTAK